jgi:hypothetical protein
MIAIRSHAAAGSALLLILSPAASAQVLGVSSTLAGAGMMPNACSAVQSHAVISTHAGVDWPLARVAWAGAVASNGGTARSTALRGELLSPEWRGWRLDATTERNRGDAACGGRASLEMYATGLTYGWERTGISLRYHKRITRNDGITRDTLAAQILGPTTRGFSLAAWHNFGRAIVALSVGSRSRWQEEREELFRNGGRVDTIPSDSGPVIITTPGPTYETRWNRGLAHSFGSELRLAWASGRLSLDALAGHSLGGRTFTQGRLWGYTDASIALTPSIALVGGYVVEDGWDSRVPAPRRYFTLGARLTSAPYDKPHATAALATRAVATAFRVVPLSDGVVTLAVRSATARLVEVTGDFVQWRPVRMQRVAADWWELRLPISPGVHRINVRVDGGQWKAPPGLPRQRDEFGGDAGLFTIS